MAESAKIFFDMLFDYKYLKYIFKYGFYWDDDITKFLLSKSSQRVREMAKAIPDSIYENCVSTPWYEYVNNGQEKKSGRLLVRQNHYRLRQNRWFQDLCGCCGSYKDIASDEKMAECEYESYNDCREDEDGGCQCQRLCKLKAQRETFLELLGGIPKQGETIETWKADIIHQSVWDNYKDVITDGESGKYFLKENIWGIPPNKSDDGGFTSHEREETDWEIFKKGPEFGKFLDMVSFFSSFTPLSALGWIFLKRLRYEAKTSYIIARNLPIEFEFEQEYLYRCLYAMNNKKTVICEEKEYIPVKLFYRDRSMAGVKEHLFLEAVPWEEQDGEARKEQLPLFGGIHVRPWTRTVKKIPDRAGQSEQAARDFQVEFYYNHDTEYLVQRRAEGWKDCIKEIRTENRSKTMESPYYKRKSWNIDVVIYSVQASDIPGFLMFIRSFGDFAKLLTPEDNIGESVIPESGSTISVRQKGWVEENESLLSVYNSDLLMKKAGRPLPPRQAELRWLEFVLKEYPGFCSVFLESESITKIQKKLEEELSGGLGDGGEWFDRKKFDFRPRVKDLEKRVWEKYKKILDAMYGGQILSYQYGNRKVRIFPYALEYDVIRHLAGGSREPMDIMCYDLDEKRTVNIPYKKIQVKGSAGREQYSFSELEKIYHVLAYAIRRGSEGKGTIGDKKAGALLDSIWLPDSRGSDNYNRLIRKKWNKKRNFCHEYEQFQKQCETHRQQEEEQFFHRTFDYWLDCWKDVTGENSDTYRYQTLLLSCFKDACRRLRAPRAGNQVREVLETMDSPYIWELIAGEPIEKTVNEIAFYNENLKNAAVSFVLKDRSEKGVEKVYDVFRNFVCAGEKLKDGRLKFTVNYEKFYYRKIHMALMALEDLIEEVEPEETARIIDRRIRNKEEA